MNEQNIQYITVKDNHGIEYVVITGANQENRVEEFHIPDEINEKRVIMIDNEALKECNAEMVILPPAIALGKNVFNDNTETVFLSLGLTPLGIEKAVDKDTEIFFQNYCDEYYWLDGMGYNVTVAQFPIRQFLPEQTQKYKFMEEKNKEKSLELAKEFFEKDISKDLIKDEDTLTKGLENKLIDEKQENKKEKEKRKDEKDMREINMLSEIEREMAESGLSNSKMTIDDLDMVNITPEQHANSIEVRADDVPESPDENRMTMADYLLQNQEHERNR